ncbi:MAG: RNA-directed polymerase [Mycobacterium sp.]|jgi:RNA-directed DNA polymerase|uniref:group II intron reverse transcriptase/maturase n=1 Tax=Mycobacterium sp. TaxID=1785 RepID=UPI0028BB85E8|nr:RNA-directed polymerase [Mycobacterium sp.]
MNLTTPEKIETLQRKLYAKAKAEPSFRFYLLYDKVYRADILAHAYALAEANKGAPGVDGVTFETIEAAGVEGWLAALAEELRARTYRSQPVRRVLIPKPGGGERPLGIPTIRDRVVQTAAKLVLEPVFEADFDPEAYGYRPGRSAIDAVRRVHGHLKAGYTDVVDADLSKYFDTIPHDELLQCVARRISDKHVLALIKMWLKTPVEERTGTGGKRLTGGKGSKHGTPQGGVISPLLANIYMNRFLKHWRQNGLGQRLKAHVVVYADDLVILSRRHASQAHEVLKDVMTRIGLTVNETKTKLREATTERFDFLGYTFGPYWDRRTGRRYLGAGPSAKSRQRLKAKVHALTGPGNVLAWPVVCDQLNMLLSGWQAYFGYGTLSRTYSEVNWYVANRVRHFLRRRHKVRSRGSRQFSTECVFEDRKVFKLARRSQRGDTPHAFV